MMASLAEMQFADSRTVIFSKLHVWGLESGTRPKSNDDLRPKMQRHWQATGASCTDFPQTDNYQSIPTGKKLLQHSNNLQYVLLYNYIAVQYDPNGSISRCCQRGNKNMVPFHFRNIFCGKVLGLMMKGQTSFWWKYFFLKGFMFLIKAQEGFCRKIFLIKVNFLWTVLAEPSWPRLVWSKHKVSFIIQERSTRQWWLSYLFMCLPSAAAQNKTYSEKSLWNYHIKGWIMLGTPVWYNVFICLCFFWPRNRICRRLGFEKF